MGLWSLCSKGNGICSPNPSTFSAAISFVCVREVESWRDHKKLTLRSPREVGVLRAFICTIRGPLECHRVYKASFSRLKKSQQIMELHSSFQIRKPGTRDHKGLIHSHTALTLTHLLIPWWMWWMLGWGPAQDQSCSYPECTGEIPGAGVASVMSALTDKAFVKKERLCDVVGRDRYHINNKHDGRYSPLPPSKIVQRAEELVGQEVLYKLTSENCEHFVNELRYGVPRSDQVGPQCVPVSIFSADAGISVDSAGVDTSAQTRHDGRDRTLPSRAS